MLLPNYASGSAAIFAFTASLFSPSATLQKAIPQGGPAGIALEPSLPTGNLTDLIAVVLLLEVQWPRLCCVRRRTAATVELAHSIKKTSNEPLLRGGETNHGILCLIENGCMFMETWALQPFGAKIFKTLSMEAARWRTSLVAFSCQTQEAVSGSEARC